MWPSLPVANHIADWANGFFIASLVVGVVSSFLIVWMSGVKEAHWERDRTESAERVALLAIQGDQLRKDTAEANARASEADRKAKEADLARLKLEEKLAPRSLSNEQQEVLRTEMKEFAGSAIDIFVYTAGAPDAMPLAVSLQSILTAAGWKARVWEVVGSGRWVKGVLIFTKEGSAPAEVEPPAVKLIFALIASGIAASGAEQFKGNEITDALYGEPWEKDKVAPIRMMIGFKKQ